MKYPIQFIVPKAPVLQRSAVAKYLVAVAAVGVSYLLRWIIEEYFHADFPPFTLFYPAVLVAAWYGGLWPGLVATLISTGVVSYFILDIPHSFAGLRDFDLLYMMIFFTVNLIISLLMENLHRVLQKNIEYSNDLVTSRKSISEMLESIQGCFFTLDPQGRFVHVNRDCEKYFPNRMKDIVGKSIWDVFPEWKPVNFGKYYEDDLKRQTGREFQFLQPGEARWHEVHFSPTDAGMTVHLHDITQRKRAELALAESENRFRTIADQAPVMIWVTGPEGESHYFNQTWLDFRGRTLEQEIKGGWSEGVHPDDLEKCLETYREAFGARKKFHMEYRLLRYDGEYRWILDSGNPRFDEEGLFLGYTGSALDITKNRKREARLKNFANSSIIGIMFGRRRHGLIREANDLFLSMIGYQRVELNKLRWQDLQPPDRDMQDQEKWSEFEKNGFCEPWEQELLRKDGSVVPVLIGLSSLDEARKEWASFVVDLSEKKLEEKRRAMEFAITQILAGDAKIKETISQILKTICQSSGWDVGIYWERIPGADLLLNSQVWTVESEKYAALKEMANPSMAFEAELFEGIRGAQRSYWMGDVAHNKALLQRVPSLSNLVVSGFGFPIFWKKKLLGVMEFFSPEKRRSDLELLNVAEAIRYTIGQFLERKQGEEDLRLSQTHFNLALQAARMGYWSWEVGTNKISWSNNLEFFHGKRAEDFAGTFEAFLDAVYPEDREIVKSTSVDAMANLHDYNLQFRSQWPDGSIHWIDVRSQVFYDEEGDPIRIVGLGIDITEAKQAQEDLKSAYDEMEKRVQLRTAELAQANRQLLAEIAERQKVEREALEIIQKEQQRFSSQLHDGLCQKLTGIKMMANAISQKLLKQNYPEGEELKAVVELINQGVTESRDLARGLFPVELEANSLMFSLQGLATRTEQVYEVACHFHCPEPILIRDNVAATHLYRIAQEGVFNAIQHGQAKTINISLLQDDGSLKLQIKDDGQGLSQDLKLYKGIGLQIMKYRSRMLDAKLNFESLGDGTIMTCIMPLTLDTIESDATPNNPMTIFTEG